MRFEQSRTHLESHVESHLEPRLDHLMKCSVKHTPNRIVCHMLNISHYLIDVAHRLALLFDCLGYKQKAVCINIAGMAKLVKLWIKPWYMQGCSRCIERSAWHPQRIKSNNILTSIARYVKSHILEPWTYSFAPIIINSLHSTICARILNVKQIRTRARICINTAHSWTWHPYPRIMFERTLELYWAGTYMTGCPGETCTLAWIIYCLTLHTLMKRSFHTHLKHQFNGLECIALIWTTSPMNSSSNAWRAYREEAHGMETQGDTLNVTRTIQTFDDLNSILSWLALHHWFSCCVACLFCVSFVLPCFFPVALVLSQPKPRVAALHGKSRSHPPQGLPPFP